MITRKLLVTGTGLVDLGEASREFVGRVAVHVVTGAATFTGTFRETLDPAKQALSTSSPQVGYTPRKSGTFTDGATAITDVLAGAEAIYDVYVDGGHLGLHLTALTGTLTLYVGQVTG